MKAKMIFLGSCSAAIAALLIPRCFDSPSPIDFVLVALFALLAVQMLVLGRKME